MWETLAHKRTEPPRLAMKPMIQRIAFASVPHLPRGLQFEWLAERITRETGEAVSAGTVKRWWNADQHDNGSVDSRHMDWARARSRTMSANDNRIMAGAPRAGDCLPGGSKAVVRWAA